MNPPLKLLYYLPLTNYHLKDLKQSCKSAVKYVVSLDSIISL